MKPLALLVALTIPSLAEAQPGQPPAALWKARGVQAQGQVEKLRRNLSAATIPFERKLRTLELLVERAYALQVTNPAQTHVVDREVEIFNLPLWADGDSTKPFLISFIYKNGEIDDVILSRVPQGWRVGISQAKNERFLSFHLEDRSAITFDVRDPLNPRVHVAP